MELPRPPRPIARDPIGEEEEIEIIEESSRPSRKRKATDGGEDTISMLQEKVRRLETENNEIKTERDYYQSRASALEPCLTMSQVHIHDIDVNTNEFMFADKYRSPPFRVDGIEICVEIEELISHSSSFRTGDDPVVVVTPYISKTSDDGPRSVMALITVRQRSECRRSRSRVYTDTTFNKLMDAPEEVVGAGEEFEPTDDLSNSMLTLRLTVVVQKVEMPGGGADAKIVVVQEKEFSVSAAYLSQWSRYFRAYFEADMEEKRTGIYPVKDEDISQEEFQEMLMVIYPTRKAITEDNFSQLLKLANRFEMPELSRQIENFLVDFNSHSVERARAFYIATDSYDLPILQATLFHRWRDAELLKDELMNTEVYRMLSPATKNMVNERFAKATIHRSSLSSQRQCRRQCSSSP